jgi:hypothetical protein
VKTDFLFEIPAMLFGIGIPLAFLLFYDKTVFGSPLNYGYRYTQGDITFAFQHIGTITQSGQSVFWNIIKTNIQNAPRNLLLGFPLLIIAIPGFFIALWGVSRRNRERWSNLSPDLRWDILLLILGWFAGVFLLYITYEWTAQIGNRPFIVFARFYLSGLFPLAVVSALLLSKFRAILSLAIIVVILAVSSVLYLQSLNIEPGNHGGGPPNHPPNGPYQPPNGNRPPGLPPGFRSGSGPPTRLPQTSTTPDQVPP